MREQFEGDSVSCLLKSNRFLTYMLVWSLFFASAILAALGERFSRTPGDPTIIAALSTDGSSGRTLRLSPQNTSMDILIDSLSTWISAQTGLMPVQPPKIVFVTIPRMSEIAMGPGIAANPQLRALYDNRIATIYLRANWSEVSLGDRSELVHELVHHFQNLHKLPYQCGAAREELAYDLQIKWLKEQGIKDPYDLLQLNHFYVVMASACRDVDHD